MIRNCLDIQTAAGIADARGDRAKSIVWKSCHTGRCQNENKPHFIDGQIGSNNFQKIGL